MSQRVLPNHPDSRFGKRLSGNVLDREQTLLTKFNWTENCSIGIRLSFDAIRWLWLERHFSNHNGYVRLQSFDPRSIELSFVHGITSVLK